MKKCFSIGAGLMLLSVGAVAQEHTLTMYSQLSQPEYIDIAPQDVSVGDMYLRRGGMSLTPDGPVVGEYYTQATIVHLDNAQQKSARSFLKEFILPDGSIYSMDFVQTDHGKPAAGRHTHEGAIVGGTGKYAGIRGTYTLEIAADAKTAKTTLRYWLGQ